MAKADKTKPPPKNWRDILGYPRGTRIRRLEIEEDDEGWLLIDRWRGECIGFNSKTAAMQCRAFANKYIKIHGDINLQSFPYRLEDEMVPPDPEEFANDE